MKNIQVSEKVERSQKEAADPDTSIWVSANAGAGKTYVLTQRVLRLLLSGVPPESILCLTYTKAAAAEMRRRVAANLAQWSLMEDARLDGVLARLEGRRPTEDMRLRARALFAHALETPGGLKIVTIHAFCESVLHRFPLEARVPFDFSVIEEDEQQAMILAAREQVLAEGLRGDASLAEPVARLFDMMSDHAISEAIGTALAEARKLRPLLLDREASKARLRKLVGWTPADTSAAITAEMVSRRLFGPGEISAIFSLTPPKGGGNTFEDKLARLDANAPRWEDWRGAFLTNDNTIPKRGFPKKAIADADPVLADLIVAEAERLAALCERLTLASLVERSEAILDVLGAISDRYEAQKRARSLLDFDDLIERLRDLLANREYADWVKYKLDAGITHILVDESQDTNPEQWKIIDEITLEFFSGEGAIERPRTLFVVGDDKQSIYSFQGADPRLFDEKRRFYAGQAAEAQKPFKSVPFRTSFRSLREILMAVDETFRPEPLRKALFAQDGVIHESAIADAGGRVTLWPPVQEEPAPEDEGEWPTEPPKSERSAAQQVADRIAREIAGWVAQKRPLGPSGRPVTANDVLILVQSRNALFHEIIRALLRHHLPTPGADRLAVTGHIGVLDLLALGDVLLNTADDLQLAALLRSPLFDIDEDALFAIAHDRPGTLWQALGACALPQAQSAWEQLTRWRNRLDFERPYEFFAEILYAEGGLKRFHARLGLEVDDVFAQFLELALAHEQSAQPSLQGFLAAMRAKNVSIKRELAEAGAGVRVMTVHGAKGLEAPIVILADAASKPDASRLGKPVYIVPEAPGPLLIHASGQKNHLPQTEPFRLADEGSQRDEYWRKLYVAMTRAEDELYVTGALTRTGKLEGTWYDSIETALRPLGRAQTDAEGNETALVYPLDPVIAPQAIAPAKEPAIASMPALVLPPLPAPEVRPVVSPSSASSSGEQLRVFDTALETLVDADAARKEGLALHALLQHLGRVSREDWDMVIDKAEPVLLPDAHARYQRLAQKAVRLLERADLQPIFGKDSRAEVPFLINARRRGEPVRLAGRVDRLVISAGQVLIVDYKSDAHVPENPEDTPQAYLTQLGLYALVASQLFPAHTVGAAILWTTMESLVNLPANLLAGATRGFTLE